jgi:hypothetical protein
MTRKKHIEVALPLESIEKAMAPKQVVRQRHLSMLHLLQARVPVAVATAVPRADELLVREEPWR